MLVAMFLVFLGTLLMRAITAEHMARSGVAP